jgi:N-acetylated-alpha-linked acidic dipeptidase
LLALTASLLVIALMPGPGAASAQVTAPATSAQVFGFRNFARQRAFDTEFLSVPSTTLAREHLQTLTATPHWASSPQDHATALYVAGRFKAAGLETQIVPYSVWMNRPTSILIEAFDPSGHRVFSGPTLISPSGNLAANSNIPFSGSSPSGDITAQVIYANYGRLEDFQRLAELGISLKGKIVLVRYGGDFRGVKVFLAEKYGARGVLIFSDPADDGSATGEPYPGGPARPDSAAQLGSVQFLPIYPGDPTTPGIASLPGLPAADRIPVDKLQYDQPTIPVNPLSASDAAHILRALEGPTAPPGWQGGLPFAYRLGSELSPVTVHLKLAQDARLRTIWDVIGRIPGTAEPDQLVLAGNHRDAWLYGAADPGSGTAALLEAVHGLGALLQHGWRPRRTIVIASWDAEEEGLIGSTEWVEQHAAELSHAVAYFNTDVAVSGPAFNAGAVPSLRTFLYQVAAEVPSPAGGTVLEQWKTADLQRRGLTATGATPQVGNLGSGSDYTPFLQHAGVPSTDIGSDGPFGVYHTVDDNFDWFTRFVDPSFAYVQQQARVLGLEVLHMADADVLPYNYPAYAEEIRGYLTAAQNHALSRGLELDFAGARSAADNLASAAGAAYAVQLSPPANAVAVDRALFATEHALLIPSGLPLRPWYRHSIYAPGLFTGYEAEVLPGVNDAIQSLDAPRAQAQINALAQALSRAAAELTSAAH